MSSYDDPIERLASIPVLAICALVAHGAGCGSNDDTSGTGNARPWRSIPPA